MNIAIYFLAAITSYLVSGLNPAIILSKAIYHKDIREEGSKNPGFTNFKRVYGMKYAWIVFVLDISKAIVLEVIFGYLFAKILGPEYRDLGIGITGLFAMLGHAYPVWYNFSGGKAFLVCVTTLFMIDWRAGLIGFGILCLFLFTIHFMSLASILAVLSGIPSIALFNKNAAENQTLFILTVIVYALCALFTTYRHKKNIVRLFKKEEPKFYFKSKKAKEPSETKKEEASASPSDENK